MALTPNAEDDMNTRLDVALEANDVTAPVTDVTTTLVKYLNTKTGDVTQRMLDTLAEVTLP